MDNSIGVILSPPAISIYIFILDHTKLNLEYNIYIGSFIVMQFYQKIKHLFMKLKKNSISQSLPFNHNLIE